MSSITAFKGSGVLTALVVDKIVEMLPLLSVSFLSIDDILIGEPTSSVVSEALALAFSEISVASLLLAIFQFGAVPSDSIPFPADLDLAHSA
jgi:hypothetical protein